MTNTLPTVVAVSGFSSNVGKTTLVSELLRLLPDWEAIKVTRGHYRSCGREPTFCCVSDLLRDEPVVLSGRELNYQAGKDTGRFWDVGAANVHWVIVKDSQVEQGINQALARVETAGVIIEGNSFLQFVKPDLAIMCARSNGGKLKPSARRALKTSDVIYLSSIEQTDEVARKEFEEWCQEPLVNLNTGDLPIFTRRDIPRLAALCTGLLQVELASSSRD